MVTLQRPILFAVFTAVALLVAREDVAAQSRRRAHLSEDLQARLRAGDSTDTSVIVSGTQARIDAIAARHGLRIRKRLESGAVLDVPAGRLGEVTEDSDLDQLSSNYTLHAHMAVTVQAIGADQVWGGDAGRGLCQKRRRAGLQPR